MTGHVPSAERIARSVAIEAGYTLARLRVLQRLPGNPVGVAYHSFGASAVAMKAGVDFACSGAAFLSTSQKNMARAGMTLQFTRALWTKLQPGPSP